MASAAMTRHDHQLLADLAALDRPAPEPLPLVTCAGCRYFRPDAQNRFAGMGRCYVHGGFNYPNAKRHCRDFSDNPRGSGDE